jgi:hypothetical protein
LGLKSERSKKGYEDRAQQKPQPVEQEAEVVADGGEYGVDGVASAMGKVIAAHAVLGLEMTDHRFDGGASFHVALDLRGDAALRKPPAWLSITHISGQAEFETDLDVWAMKIARHRGMKKAIVALARRLAVIMHRIWVDGTEFRWSREEAAA